MALRQFNRRISYFLASLFALVFILTFHFSSSFAQGLRPGGGGDGGSKTCNNDPNTYACLDPSFCKDYPDNIRCTDIYWCETFPNDPKCITPEFCKAQPTHPLCIPDKPKDCSDYAGIAMTCKPDSDSDPGNDPAKCLDAFGNVTHCPSDLPPDCQKNPYMTQCINPDFCDMYPTNINCKDPGLCEKNPDATGCKTPEFCQLNPTNSRCVSDEPSDCRDAKGLPVPCKDDSDTTPWNDPSHCYDDFGQPTHCPSDLPEGCDKNPYQTQCINPSFCQMYPTNINCKNPGTCELNPDATGCKTPEFCQLNPNNERCVPGEPQKCEDAKASIVPCKPDTDKDPGNDPVKCFDDFGQPTHCPSDLPPDCQKNPYMTQCINPKFCDMYPTNINCKDPGLCEKNPDATGCKTPEFCQLNPGNQRCVSGEPKDCTNYAGIAVTCKKDGDPGNDPKNCYDDFGQITHCPSDSANGCDLHPYAKECVNPKFCEMYPTNIVCKDPGTCDKTADTTAECTTPEFCRLNPTNVHCISGEPKDCRDEKGTPMPCKPDSDKDPGNDPVKCFDDFGLVTHCPSDLPPDCQKNPYMTQCINPDFCKMYPTNINCTNPGLCEKNPDATGCKTPEFCQLNPGNERCVSGEPKKCEDAKASIVPCKQDGDPGNDPKNCYDDFGQPTHCPGGVPDFCAMYPKAMECMKPGLCDMYPTLTTCQTGGGSEKFCRDGSEPDALGRCPNKSDNGFPGDNGRKCFAEVPGLAKVMVEVPCGKSDDGVCVNPNDKNDPNCCPKENWIESDGRCADPADKDGVIDPNVSHCVKEVDGHPGLKALILCKDQKLGGDECQVTIGTKPYLAPCDQDKKEQQSCVDRYDQAMCDNDPYNDYTDLPKDAGQRDAIVKLAEYCPNNMKIFKGYTDKKGTLTHKGGWNDPIIRYDAILVLQRFVKCSELQPYAGKFPFVDVPKDHYAYDAIGRSFDQGQTEGYTNGKGQKEFRGNQNVLTTEALKWIMLTKATQASVDIFTDGSMLDPEVFGSVKWAMKWWLAAIDWKIVAPGLIDPNDKGGLVDPNDKGALIDPNDKGALIDPNEKGGLVDPNDKGALIDPNEKGGFIGLNNKVTQYYDVHPLNAATRGEVALWLANTLGL